MKQIIWSCIFVLLLTKVLAQKIVTNKTDEFTQAKIVESDWGKLQYNFDGNAFFRIRKVNEKMYFEFKRMIVPICSIPKDASLYFKLDNDSIVQIHATEYSISGRGNGAIGLAGSNAMGIEAEYLLTGDALNTLKNGNVTKIRYYLSDTYVEFDVKKSFSIKLRATFNLF